MQGGVKGRFVASWLKFQLAKKRLVNETAGFIGTFS
jgi:hypothetical protein